MEPTKAPASLTGKPIPSEIARGRGHIRVSCQAIGLAHQNSFKKISDQPCIAEVSNFTVRQPDLPSSLISRSNALSALMIAWALSCASLPSTL